MPSPKEKKTDTQIDTGMISWSSKPQLSKTADNFDWGTPSTDLKVKTDDFVLSWDDEDKEEISSDSDDGLSMNIGKKDEEEEPEEESITTEQIDIMAQQLKFVACLKILMEELSTLATGFEVDGYYYYIIYLSKPLKICFNCLGGQLRYQLYIWLEKEVEALRELCNYASDLTDAMDLEQPPDAEVHENKEKEREQRPTLTEILIQEKMDFEAKVQRAAKRRRWLRGKFYF